MDSEPVPECRKVILMVKAGNGNKVLIIEDESLIAKDIAEKLQSYGYDIIGIAASGREAIDLAINNPPDIMLIDISLIGDLNGIETAIVIQGQSEREIPVIFLTALPSGNFPVLQAVEPYLYLNKPFTYEELLESINRLTVGGEDLRNPPPE